MRPEMKLLVDRFAGERWTGNRDLQKVFAAELGRLPAFRGSISKSDPTFSARDRITRGPKSLGLVNLDKIGFTEPGLNFCDDAISQESLLRQLLKFQVPSPFHVVSKKLKKRFWVKPYLEMLRLVHALGRLAFDELCLFGMQLADWHDFDAIVDDVRRFRIQKEVHKGQYKAFLHSERARVVTKLFEHEIASGHMHTRESTSTGIGKFIETKAGNMRDYADACLRYLRATGLVTVSNPGRMISIIESRRDEVEYILNSVVRDPVFVTDEVTYRNYLYDGNAPVLLTDNRKALERKAVQCGAVETLSVAKATDSKDLKKRIRLVKDAQRKAIIDAQITELKAFTKYDEVMSAFAAIKTKSVFDPPLALEWNVWRAMTMMDGGRICANLAFDEAGNPLSTAPGNNPDIVCDYGNFNVIVEVTLMSGSRQYDAEGEPVARHLGDIKAKTGKPAYCLFVAPTINAGVISHFYALHRIFIKHYGGKSVVIPLTLTRFMGMLEQSRNCGYIPAPEKIKAFCEYSMMVASDAEDEEAWYAAVSNKADNWLA